MRRWYVVQNLLNCNIRCVLSAPTKRIMSTTIYPGDRYECKNSNTDWLRKNLEFPIAKNIVAKNRLVKAPMIEMLATYDPDNPENSGLLNEPLINMNRKFASGGCGIIVTGCILVSDNHIGAPGVVTITKRQDSAKRQKWFKKLAKTVSGTSLIVGQIVHPGKLGVGLSGEKFEPFDINTVTVTGIQELIEQHVYAAEFLYKAGFHGVEINVSMDFALGQMVNAEHNRRSDEFGGTLENRTKALLEIIKKISSTNYESMFDQEEFKNYCERLDGAKLDYLMVAGGHHKALEKYALEMSESTKKRETFFVEFSKLTRKYLKKVKVIVVGGFVTAEQITEVLSNGHADAVAMARALAAEPDLPHKMLNEKIFSAKKSIISDLDFSTRKNAAGMQLWQIANNMALLDLTNENHVEAFQRALVTYLSKPKVAYSKGEDYGYPKLDVDKIETY